MLKKKKDTVIKLKKKITAAAWGGRTNMYHRQPPLTWLFLLVSWLPLPFLLPRGPKVQGRRPERLRKCPLCKLCTWDPGDGGRKGEGTDR